MKRKNVKRSVIQSMSKNIREKAYELGAVLLCLTVLCVFVSFKEGYHMDELLSFELANAEFNPWIVTTQPEGRLAKFVRNEIDGENAGETLKNIAETVRDVLQNRGNSKLLTYKADVYEEPVWITAEQFSDYITVEGRDAFNYLSVYFNVKDDNHPPLHFMLLHTISSLFQGKISPWMGCAVNLAAIIGILILLFRICELLAPALGLEKRQRQLGIMAVLFYGLSTGAVATTLLIRMYGMVTLWCVLYFYLVLKKWQDASFDKHNLKLILVTALGFWTQYFFLFYCILLAIVVSVCLARNKRFRELFCFVRSMVAAAAVGLCVFPFAISDVFSSGRGVEAIGNLSQGFSGYGIRLAAFWRLLMERSVGLICPAVLLFLLAAYVKRRIRSRMAAAKGFQMQERAELLWMLIFPAAGYFFLAARMSPYLVDRYIMPLFPFAALIVVLAAFALMEAVESVYPFRMTYGLFTVICSLLLLSQIWGLAQYDGSYLYSGYGLQEKTAREHEGYSCICIYDGVGYYENLIEFTYYEKSLLLTLEELRERKDRQSIEELDRVAVVVKRGVDALEVLDILMNSYGFRLEEQPVFQPSAYGDEVYFLTDGS